jgi:hypothetical protein
LVNTKLGRDDWEAYTNNYIWNGEATNGTVIKPHDGQLIRVTPEGHQSSKLQGKSKAKQRAWERLLDAYPDEVNWTLSEEEREEAEENPMNEEMGQDNPYLTISSPQSETLLSLQVPKGNEWAYFTAFMDRILREDKWIAGFSNGFETIQWTSAGQVPKRYQLINIIRVEEEKSEQFTWNLIPITPLTPIHNDQGRESDREEKVTDTQKILDTTLGNTKAQRSEPKRTRMTTEPDTEAKVNFVVQPLFLGSVHEVRLKGRTRKRIITITLADACHKVTGGNPVPLQSMQIEEQQPLSLECMSMPTQQEEKEAEKAEPPDKPRSEDEEDEWYIDYSGPPSSDSEDEDEDDNPEITGELTPLEPVPTESITCPEVHMLQITTELWEDPDIKADRSLGSALNEWLEEYSWNYTARKVAVRWFLIWKEGRFNPRLPRKLWEEATSSDTMGSILEETFGEQAEDMFNWAQTKEWDEFMKRQGVHRRQDPFFDYKMATLIYYNDDIDLKEKRRRWGTLKREEVKRAMTYCRAVSQAPKPEGWHYPEENIRYTEEMSESIDEKWWDTVEILENLPTWTLEKRKGPFEAYYSQERKAWEVQFDTARQDYKRKELEYGKLTEEGFSQSEALFKQWNLTWKSQMQVGRTRRMEDNPKEGP